MRATPVVGVGASAGGLEAFQEFLSNLPPDTGQAFVLVQHIDPNHESHLPELLSKWTAMPVEHIENGDTIQANRVYLAPPKSYPKIEGDRFRLVEFEQPRGLRRPIDSFFQSLAEEMGSNCACVILSGTGSDGTTGMRRVRESGGLALVQEPGTARYDGMPNSAANTGLADHVIPIAAMPRLLQDYFANHDRAALSDTDSVDLIMETCTILRNRLGQDFTNYKRATLARRIARRIQVSNAQSPQAYLDLLHTDMEECELLFRDLLIHVTEFFRDPKAFEILAEKAIAGIVRAKSGQDTIRIWVPGCSSGEEAYTIAILVREALKKHHSRPRVQIFATDIDPAMISVARAGVYPDSIAAQVPAEYLAEYFVPGESTFTAGAAIQELIVFSVHNLIKDPPFSHLDLISCRNVMIYMEHALRDRILSRFLYALRPGGHVFLGPSEGLSLEGGDFDTVDLPARLYRKSAGAQSRPLDLDTILAGSDPGPSPRFNGGAYMPHTNDGLVSEAARAILHRYAPAHILVNRDDRVLYTSGNVTRYAEFPRGRPRDNIFDMIRSDLRLPLGAAMERIAQGGRRAVVRDITVRSETGEQVVDLVVESLSNGDRLILFRDLMDFRAGTADAVLESAALPQSAADDSERVRILEEELENTRDQLRNTVEQLETSNEELKSSNEEMMSMNEELQSTNEELTTVNDELKDKVNELARANGDLENFFNSTPVATLFLDKSLSIDAFTPAAAHLFNLKPHDKGRRLTDFSIDLENIDLEAKFQHVLETLQPFEGEVRFLGSPRSFFLRITPYRTLEDVIDGLVLTFTEITELKQAQSATQASQLRYAAAVAASAHVVFDWEPESDRIVYSGSLEALTGYTAEELSGGLERFIELVVEEERDTVRTQWRDAVKKREPLRHEFNIRRKDGSLCHCESRGNLFDAGGGAPARLVGFLIDNSHRAELERTRELLMRELQHRVKNTLAMVDSIVRQTARTKSSKKEFEEAISARIVSMARTHNLVSESGWEATPLSQIISSETEPYAGGRDDAIEMKGEEVLVPGDRALTLTLAMHELTTNAVKYGALSTVEGRVSISWRKLQDEEGAMVQIDWAEHGGPKVKPGPGRGFGRTLLERGLARDGQGSVELEFAEEGVRARLTLRL